MYEANSPKELRKLLKENKLPILVKDHKTQKIVKTMESLKKKGFIGAMIAVAAGMGGAGIGAGEKAGNAGDGKGLLNQKGILIIVGILAFVGISISFYALYLDKDIEVEFGKDGLILRAKAPNSKDN